MRRKKSVLLLPGPELKDLDLGIESGVFTAATRFVLVERGRRVYDRITAAARRMDLKYRAFHGDLHNVRLPWHLDYAFIDLFGNLRLNEEIRWLRHELLRLLSPGADLAFTFCLQTRGNTDIPEIGKRAAAHFPKVFHARCAEVGHLPSSWRPVLATYLTLFKDVLLAHYEFDPVQIMGYADDRSPNVMLLFKIPNIRCRRRPRPVLPLLGGDHPVLPPHSATAPPKAVAMRIVAAKTAGQKAAATRMLDALVHRRQSDGYDPDMVRAGVKSWITRLSA